MWEVPFCSVPSVRSSVPGFAESVSKQDALICHSQALSVSMPVRYDRWSNSAATTHLSFCRAHSVGCSMPCLLAFLWEEAPHCALQCAFIAQGGLCELLQQVLRHPLLEQYAQQKRPGAGQQQA